MDGDKNNHDKIIYFPSLEDRDRLKKEKSDQEKQREKEKDKAEKDKQFQEKLWRDQYHAQKARAQANQARLAANGNKVPFFNFDRIPLFTRSMVIILLIVHIIKSFLLTEQQALEVVYRFGFTPAVFTSGNALDVFALATPLTSLFIHEGWMHIAFNILMLLVMGVLFERQLGARNTIKVYFMCGIIGDLLYFTLSPFSTVPVIGASGAITGLFAFSFLMIQDFGVNGHAPQKNKTTSFILIWLAIIVGFGLLSPNTAWQAHLGGFFAGLGIYQLWKRGKIRF